MKATRRPDPPARADRNPPPASTALHPAPRSLILWGAGLLLLLLVAYSNHFRNGFHFDDSHVIENNAYIRSLRNIPRFFRDASTFSSYPQNAAYRPLVSATLALDYWFAGGLDPVPFHVTQLTLHALLGALVFFFLLRVLAISGLGPHRGLAALLGSGLFLLHTVQTETLNFLSSRSEILSTAGVVGSFVLYQYAPRWRRNFVWMLPAVLGAFAKPSAIVLAPLVAIYLLLFAEELPRDRAGGAAPRRRAVWSVVWPAFVFAFGFYLLQDRLSGAEVFYGSTPRLEYLQTQVFAWLHYVRLFLFPLGLSADTDWEPITEWYDSRVFAGLLVAGLLTGASVLYARRRAPGKAVLFGVLWFYVALAPSSSVFPLSEMINEHRPYFPYIGLVLAAAAGIADGLGILRARRGSTSLLARAVLPLSLLLLTSHAAATYERNKVWATDETLWRSVTAASPRNARAWMNYGLIFMARGDYANARYCFERARTIAPNYDILEINLGILDGATGNRASAEAHFRRAISLKGNLAGAHFYYGRWLAENNRLDEAARNVELAVEKSPADLTARHLLLDVYEKRGEAERACALAGATLEVVPSDPKASEAQKRLCGGGAQAPSRPG
ncbi:MAG: tetratricopeptide repeat protein [Thermoanaerobaculia bacterium]